MWRTPSRRRATTTALALVIGLIASVPITPLVPAAHAAGAAPVITSISIDGTARGIGTRATPRFDWIVTDADRGESVSDYTLTVTPPGGASWTATNSLRAASPTGVTYSGPTLASSTRYAYSLSVVDGTGNRSAVKAGTFVTGIVREADWQATWIQREAVSNAFHGRFRKEFTLASTSIVSATLSLTAKGLVEARLNGRDVDGDDTIAGDEMLQPKRTNTSQRVLVRTYDVTTMVQAGANAIGLEIVNGWYRTLPSGGVTGGETSLNTSPAQVLAQLTVRYSDGTTAVIATDGSWTTSAGPIVSEVPLLGEIRDERIAVAQAGWAQTNFTNNWVAALASPLQPAIARVADAGPPIAVVASTPASASQISTVTVAADCAAVVTMPTCPTAPPGCRALNTAGLAVGDSVVIVDVGRIVSGFVSLHGVQPASGKRIEVAYGQTLNTAGRVDERLTAGHWSLGPNACRVTNDFSALASITKDAFAHQVDAFVANGSPTTLAPQFSYKSFRYVEIRGLPAITAAQVTVHEVRDAIGNEVGGASHATFASSDSSLDALWRAASATIGNQMHGLLEDNVIRERVGWAADTHLVAEAALETTDSGEFWQKWIDDAVADIAQPPGLTTYTHPGNGYGGPLDPVWSAALPLVAWRTYLHTGNGDVLRAAWANGAGVPALVDAFDAIAADGTPGPQQAVLADGTVRIDDPLLMDVVPWTYSDHLTRTPSSTTVMNTASYITVLRTSAAIARALDMTKVADGWTQRADTVVARFESVFWNPATGRYEGMSPDQFYGPGTVGDKTVVAQTTQVMGPAAGTTGATSALDLIPGAGACASLTSCPVASAIGASITDGLLTTGIVGTASMFRTLVLYGMADLGQLVALDNDNYMPLVTESGAIAEGWPPALAIAGVSRDQPALAAGPIEWIVSGLAGVRPSAAGPGFAKFDLRPLQPAGLTSVDLSLQTAHGTVRSAWRRTSMGTRFDVTVPVGSTATMTVPRATAVGTGTISIDSVRVVTGASVSSSIPVGVTVVSANDGAAVLRIGSGTYVVETAIATGTSNLALGRPVTASSVTGISQWAAANAVDGITAATTSSIGWHAQLGLPTASSTQALTVDLGSTRDITSISISPAQPPGYVSGWYFPVRYAIDVSDSPSFPAGSTTIVVVSGVTARPSSALVHTVTGVRARYVRFRTLELRTEGAGYSAAIGELQVVGSS